MSRVVTCRPVKLVIFSTPEHLPVVRAATEKLCCEIGFGEEATSHVMLSVDEALTNVIRHAYGGASDQTIEIELIALGGGPAVGVEIRIRDHGRAVDPSRIKARDLRDVRPGGLGVHIMNRCMDRLEYRRAEGGGTLLTMTKRLPAVEKGRKP